MERTFNRRRFLYTAERKTKTWSWAFVRTVFILGFSFVILYPLLNMLARAFMEPQDLYDSSVLWLPRHFTTINLQITAKSLQYGKAFLNSLWSSGLATLLQLFSCLTAGYAFARYRFPLRGPLFVCVLMTLIIPPQLTMISSYMYFSDLSMIGTQWPMMLMSATGTGIRSGLFIYLFRQFFLSMPKETEEAAMVDGAGHFRIFFEVMLPGALTIVVTVALFSFVWQWNDVFFVNLYDRTFLNLSNSINSANFSNHFTAYTEYAGFSQFDPVINKNLQSVSALLIVAPLVLLFAVMQRYFVESVERSGVVG
ncbi:MAG: carbohydrate ABC transporter permease [Clostridia bacterium]|nr:carbohydrate ABC transporter permease [Clostridia bacterium]